MSRSPHQPSEPAYYIEDCWIFCSVSLHPFLTTHTFCCMLQCQLWSEELKPGHTILECQTLPLNHEDIACDLNKHVPWF